MSLTNIKSLIFSKSTFAKRPLSLVFPLLAVLVFSGLFFSDIWPCNIFSHFPVQWVVLFLAWLVWFIIKRKYVHSAICAVLVLLNTVQIMPYLKTNDLVAANQAQSNKSIRLIQMNIFVGNMGLEQTANFIKNQSPDVLAIEEFNKNAYTALKKFHSLDQYPTQLMIPNHGYGSQIALFSKYPLKTTSVEYADQKQSPTLIAQLQLKNEELLNVMVLHPSPPGRPLLLTKQAEHFKLVSSLIPKYGKNVVVMGDLNTSPWAKPFQDLIKSTGLRDPRVGYGLMPSWPIFLPPLLIPIDYILVGHSINVKNYSVGPSMGSDHLPLIMDIAI